MSARTTTKSIRDLLDHIDNNELVLPEIQREFVWSGKSVKLLFDSLYSDLPIGHMLVWKAKRAVQTRQFAHKRQAKQAFHEGFYGYLLDGQQRLTALSLVRNNDDDYKLLFNLWQEPEEGSELFYWSGRWAERDYPWVPSVAEIFSPKFRTLDYLKLLKGDAESWKDTYEQPIHDMLERLRKVLDVHVGITEYESDSYEDATKLFIRFNGTGRKLNKSNLLVAELAQRVPGLTSNELAKASTRWQPQFRFTLPFQVQCLAAVHTGRMNWKQPKALWSKSTQADIRESWKTTERALSEVVKVVTGTVHWDSAAWLPSFNALIPLVVVLAAQKELSPSDRDLARRWLLLTTFHSYFSGAVYTQLDKVLRRLQPKPTMTRLWQNTRRRLRRLRGEDFETGRIAGPAMSLYMSMLRHTHARDWKEHTPLDGSVLGHNAKLQVHHFFPRALLNKYDYESSRIDTFANYTIISANTNLGIGAEAPATYLPREKINEQDLDQQCVPLDPSLWQVDRYKDFLEARRKLLAQRANDFLNV